MCWEAKRRGSTLTLLPVATFQVDSHLAHDFVLDSFMRQMQSWQSLLLSIAN